MGQRGPVPTVVTFSYRDKDALRRAAKAQAMRKKGYKIKEICNELNRSESTICLYLKTDLNATVRQGLMDDEKARRKKAELAPIELKEDINIIKFCEDPSYLNFRPNPNQKLILKCFYGLPFSEKEQEVLYALQKEGKTTWKKGQVYRELVVVAGMKGGKTVLASLISCYEEYSLYCLGDPLKYYGFPEGQKIFIINVATSSDQAEDTIFAQTAARIDHSPFFGMRPYEKTGTTINFKDTGVKMRSGHSNSASIVGKLAKLVLFDELARFKTAGGRSSAESVYTSLTRSVEPFGEDGKIVSISSPLWDKDKIMQLFRISKQIPNMLGFWLSTWFMNPKITRYSLRWEFKKNPEAAQRDFGADPSRPSEIYYRVPEKIEETFKRARMNPSPMDQKGRLKKGFRGNTEFDYYLHGDPAARNDAFGLCLGHRLGDKVYLDLICRFTAETGEIDVVEIKNIIVALIDAGFRIKKATFDTWAAVSVWQALQSKGVNPENLYVLKPQHDALKEVIYQGNLVTHVSAKLEEELKGLLQLRGMKIHHGEGGSDDMAGAAAAVAYHCMQESPVQVASSSKDPDEKEKQEVLPTRESLFTGRRLLASRRGRML